LLKIQKDGFKHNFFQFFSELDFATQHCFWKTIVKQEIDFTRSSRTRDKSLLFFSTIST
jgi:hypothetical protein